jgi:hypothetical protein
MIDMLTKQYNFVVLNEYKSYYKNKQV